MITIDTIIVGGGPAGSSCAWKLKRAGRDCLVLDRETFPRTKLCAGWITPEVVEDLEMDPESYPHSFMTFPAMHVHIFGLSFTIPVPQHSIRRYEFDRWLLERSGAEVAHHYVQDIRRENDFYVIDGSYRCKYLVGAGGTRCPVYRTLFAPSGPRSADMQVVALEQELPYDWHNGECHLWFFQGGLRGYSWYVPKAGGHLNVGVGGIADSLKRRKDTIKNHWAPFTRTLHDARLVDGIDFETGGYSYYLRDAADVGRRENAFVVGDAAGLATRDMAEGIGPAIRSGFRAAEAITGGRPFGYDDAARFSTVNEVARRLKASKLFATRRRAVA